MSWWPAPYETAAELLVIDWLERHLTPYSAHIQGRPQKWKSAKFSVVPADAESAKLVILRGFDLRTTLLSGRLGSYNWPSSGASIRRLQWNSRHGSLSELQNSDQSIRGPASVGCDGACGGSIRFD